MTIEIACLLVYTRYNKEVKLIDVISVRISSGIQLQFTCF